MSEGDGSQGWWLLRANPITQEETKSKATHGKRVLQSKENVIKNTCNRTLRKKLKKYKLKRHGKEDPDVLNVSKTLHQSLKIRSPCKSVEVGDLLDIDEIARPENYLIKMVRRKQLLLDAHVKGNRVTDDGKCKTKSKSKSQKQKIENRIPVKNTIEQKKQTNAFQLMMDSRNKSIGGNSPGKELTVNEEDTEEITEKKLTKVKRMLVLEKMAEAKGSVKNKELEDLKEECIKVKLENRADRLKKMITNGTNKKLKKKEKLKKREDEKKELKFIKDADIVFIPDSDLDNEKAKTSQSVKINGAAEEDRLSGKHKFTGPQTKIITKEDKDFLNKLSPSIRKTENMLSYFKKIEKVTENNALSEDDNLNCEIDKSHSIKVKFTPKNKKKSKKKKLSLVKKENALDVDFNENTREAILNKEFDKIKVENGENHEKVTRKRKRKEEIDLKILSDNTDLVNTDVKESSIAERRPKRIVRQSIKYVDDVQLSSSEEELHVFTPKKKKHLETKDDNKHNTRPKSKDNVIDVKKEKDGKKEKKTQKDKRRSKLEDDGIVDLEDDATNDTKSQNRDEKLNNKASSKLAPIFKPKLDPAVLEAKQKFLQSGMPDQMKKVVAQQKAQSIMLNNFTSVVHVHQNEMIPAVALHNKDFIFTTEDEYDADEAIAFDENDMKSILGAIGTKEIISNNENIEVIDVRATLKTMKDSYPEFPVYRTYNSLNNKRNGDHKNINAVNLDNSADVLNDVTDSKNEDPDSLSWTDKYRATSTNQIIGNFDSVKELKKWLDSWKENENICRAYGNDDSDSDFYHSDTDSRDSMRISNNLFVLTGPSGTGKTSSVYAVATELSMKVIEVNVSSKRTGKILLQDLQEATQSHKVNRNKGGGAENSQNSQELLLTKRPKGFKKQYKNKKLAKNSDSGTFSQRSDSFSQSQGTPEGCTRMSLILIDDADIVFDQDDGFISGIAQLVQCSKRPVILVTGTLTCPHLQKFLLCGNIVKMNPLSPRMLGTWLDVMCLVDTAMCWPGTGAKFLDYFKGDMRKTINCLQFYMYTEAQKRKDKSSKDDERRGIVDIDDENSNTSWEDYSEDKIDTTVKTSPIQNGVWKYFVANPNNMLNIEYPSDLLSVWWNVPHILNLEESKQVLESKEQTYKGLEDISAVFDSISLADCLGDHDASDARRDICSDPWQYLEADSVLERDNFDEVNNHCQVSKEIAYDLVKRSLDNTRVLFKTPNSELRFPGSKDRRKRDKTIQMHDVLTNSFSTSTVLDRRALSLDYWSTCRTICRVEKEKTDNNSKRNNRFCHYLKSAKVMCKNDVFDKLCNSLRVSETEE